MNYCYYPMHMHMHAACDYGASMALDMYNAQVLGMKYIWFTDHDTRMGTMKNAIGGFNFDVPELVKIDEAGRYHGFKVINDTTQYSIDTASETMTLKSKAGVDGEWQSAGIYFASSGTRHTKSLAAEVTLNIRLQDYDIDENSRIIFAIKLSQRPPELKNAYLLYVLGSTDGLETPYTQVISLEKEKDIITMPISSDVSEEIGGKDNAFDTIYIVLQSRNGVEVSATLSEFKILVEKKYEDVHLALKEVAKKVGEKYGVTPFVSFEVSGAGEHKNCFTSSVPVIDYQKYNYKVTRREAINHVKEHKGVFAINHPFSSYPLKRKALSESYRMDILTKKLCELIATKAYGAQLIEVGFPEGRSFPLEDYLLLWDLLSKAGLFLTGYGCNDCHRDNTGWFEGNNFAAYIGVDSRLNHPICEKEFTEAMKKGRLYMADPTKIKGDVIFQTAYGHQMGTVFLSKDITEVPIEFSAKQTKKGWKFRLIGNGEEIYSEWIMGTEFSYKSTLSLTSATVNFQRAELWDDKDRCILLTNPIYLVNTDYFAGEISSCRIASKEENGEDICNKAWSSVAY